MAKGVKKEKPPVVGHKESHNVFTFVKNHPELSKTQAYFKFVESGGEIRKKTWFEVLNSSFGLESKSKGVSIGKQFEEKGLDLKLFVPSGVDSAKIFVNKKPMVYNMKWDSVQHMKTKIEELNGYKESNARFLSVELHSKSDHYKKGDKDRYFQIHIPDKAGKTTYNQGEVLNAVIKQAEVYYSNLAALYKGQKGYVKSRNPFTPARIKKMEKMTSTEKISYLKTQGIKIGNVRKSKFTFNENEED